MPCEETLTGVNNMSEEDNINKYLDVKGMSMFALKLTAAGTLLLSTIVYLFL